MTAFALAAIASLAAAGAARAGWLDWLQGLSTNQDAGSNTTAVAAVRGLGEDDSKDSGARNFRAIDKLDKLEISSADVAKFVREGHLAQ